MLMQWINILKLFLKKLKILKVLKKKNDLMEYYIDELQKNKMIDLTK